MIKKLMFPHQVLWVLFALLFFFQITLSSFDTILHVEQMDPEIDGDLKWSKIL